MVHTLRRVALSVALLSVPLAALAALGVFPDVPDAHPFKGEIESLYRSGIVKGNPNGKYEPERSINRAEFLKLLYTVTKRTTRSVASQCFKDVPSGSWFETIVCDAASKENRFVQGYQDGTFRPANPVSRTEALKMTFTVMGLEAGEVSSIDKEIVKFADISVSAWYTKYVSAAYRNGMFPIFGFGGARFYPDRELTRGEAAAYIFNALKVTKAPASSSSSSASSSARSADFAIKNVVFPFNVTDAFVGKTPIAYEFTLSGPKTIVAVNVGTLATTESDVTCRLYLMAEDGFSEEYYLGVQDKNSCKLIVAARSGTYQLQIQPTVKDVPYFVDARAASTDGNDGFVDAVPFPLTEDRSGSLDGAGDLFDWFTVVIPSEREGTIFVGSSPDRLECIIYSPESVDLFGFAGPECGVQYRYPSGTYTIGVGRKSRSDLSKNATYTIRWR